MTLAFLIVLITLASVLGIVLYGALAGLCHGLLLRLNCDEDLAVGIAIFWPIALPLILPVGLAYWLASHISDWAHG